MIFLLLKIPLICLNKSTPCQSTLKSKDLCQKESQWPKKIFSTKTTRLYYHKNVFKTRLKCSYYTH